MNAIINMMLSYCFYYLGIFSLCGQILYNKMLKLSKSIP